MEVKGHKVILIRDMNSLEKSLMSVEDFVLVASSDGGKTFKSSIFDMCDVYMLQIQVIEVDKIRDRDGNLIEDPDKLPTNLVKYGQYVYKIESTDITAANLDRIISYGLKLEEVCYGRNENGSFYGLESCYLDNGVPNPELKDGYKTKKIAWDWFESGTTKGITSTFTKNLRHAYVTTKQVEVTDESGQTNTVNKDVVDYDVIYERMSHLKDGLFKTVNRGWGALFRFVNYRPNTLTQMMYGQAAYSNLRLGNMTILEYDQDYNEKKFNLLDPSPSGWVDFSDIGENYFGGITKGLPSNGHPGYWFWDEYLGWHWFTAHTFPHVFIDGPTVLAGNYSTIDYGGTVESDGRVLISEGSVDSVKCENNSQGLDDLQVAIAAFDKSWNDGLADPGINMIGKAILFGTNPSSVPFATYHSLAGWMDNYPNSPAFAKVAEAQAVWPKSNFDRIEYIYHVGNTLLPYIKTLEVEKNKCIDGLNKTNLWNEFRKDFDKYVKSTTELNSIFTSSYGLDMTEGPKKEAYIDDFSAFVEKWFGFRYLQDPNSGFRSSDTGWALINSTEVNLTDVYNAVKHIQTSDPSYWAKFQPESPYCQSGGVHCFPANGSTSEQKRRYIATYFVGFIHTKIVFGGPNNRKMAGDAREQFITHIFNKYQTGSGYTAPVYKKNADGTTFFVPKDSKGNFILTEINQEQGDYEPAGWATFNTNGTDSRTPHIYVHKKGCWSDLNLGVLVEGQCSSINDPAPSNPEYSDPARCPFVMKKANITKFYDRKYEPGSAVYNVGDDSSFTVPYGVYSIIVEAMGGGGSGARVSYQYGNWYNTIEGSNGGNTVFKNSTSGFILTAQGGNGGNVKGTRGAVIVSSDTYVTEATISEAGGLGQAVNSNTYQNSGAGRGGNSYLANGTTYDHTGMADVSGYKCSGSATKGAGSAPGYIDNQDNNVYGGDAGAYAKYVIKVNPGDLLEISVGKGGAGGSNVYTRGGDIQSCAGIGGNGFLNLTW